MATYIESSMISDMIGSLSNHITDGLILLYLNIFVKDKIKIHRVGLGHGGKCVIAEEILRQPFS